MPIKDCKEIQCNMIIKAILRANKWQVGKCSSQIMVIPSNNAPRLNNKEIGNLNRPIISKEVELVFKNLPTKTVQDQTASQ